MADKLIILDPKQTTTKEKSEKTPGKLLLIIALVCFIYIFIPEPTDLIPGIGWLDELFAGSVSIGALLTWFIRYWLVSKFTKK